MPKSAHLGVVPITPESVRDRTLHDIYRTVSDDLKGSLRSATGLASHGGALGFIRNPHHYSHEDTYAFAERIGWDYGSIMLPLVLNAQHRERATYRPEGAIQTESPSIHERMVINPTDGEPENLPQIQAEFATSNPARIQAGDRVLVKGSWQGSVLALNEEEGRILVEFQNGVMEQFDPADVLVVEEEEEEEGIEREGRALLREALQYLELPFQIGERVVIRNGGTEGTIEDVNIDGGINNPMYRVRHEHGWINCYADSLCPLQEEEEEEEESRVLEEIRRMRLGMCVDDLNMAAAYVTIAVGRYSDVLTKGASNNYQDQPVIDLMKNALSIYKSIMKAVNEEMMKGGRS